MLSRSHLFITLLVSVALLTGCGHVDDFQSSGPVGQNNRTFEAAPLPQEQPFVVFASGRRGGEPVIGSYVVLEDGSLDELEGSPLATLEASQDLEVSGNVLYTLANSTPQNNTTIRAYSISQLGLPTLLEGSEVTTSGSAQSMSLSQDGQFLFVSNSNPPSLDVFRREEGGAISLVFNQLLEGENLQEPFHYVEPTNNLQQVLVPSLNRLLVFDFNPNDGSLGIPIDDPFETIVGLQQPRQIIRGGVVPRPDSTHREILVAETATDSLRSSYDSVGPIEVTTEGRLIVGVNEETFGASVDAAFLNFRVAGGDWRVMAVLSENQLEVLQNIDILTAGANVVRSYGQFVFGAPLDLAPGARDLLTLEHEEGALFVTTSQGDGDGSFLQSVRLGTNLTPEQIPFLSQNPPRFLALGLEDSVNTLRSRYTDIQALAFLRTGQDFGGTGTGGGTGSPQGLLGVGQAYQIAMDTAGNVVSFFSGGENNNELQVNLFEPRNGFGATLFEVLNGFRLNALAFSIPDDLASDDSGNFFTLHRINDFAGALTVAGFDDARNPTPLFPAFEVAPGDEFYQPAIASDGQGNFLSVFHNVTTRRLNSDVLRSRDGQAIEIDGNPVGPIDTVLPNFSTAFPDLEASRDGTRWILIWIQDNVVGQIVGQVYDAQLNPIQDFEITPGNGNIVEGARLDVDANGDFVTVWSERSQVPDRENDVYYRRFNSQGIPLDADPILVTENDFGDQRRPDVAMDDAGNFVVTWQEGDVRARRFTADGLGGNEFRVADGLFPRIESNPAGDFVVAYYRNNLSFDIFHRSFARDFVAPE